MYAEQLAETVRRIAIDGVKAVSKPVSIQIGVYLGENKVRINGELDVEAVIPTLYNNDITGTTESGEAVTVKIELKENDSVIVAKEDGSWVYYVIGKV